ncbi:hypothetical protein FT669_01785 [Aeromonas jandaei]|nr:hypothetical protein FT669_01785 [Aeromonas jandaei]
MVTRSPDSVARQYVIEAKLAVASLMERNGLSQSDVARIIGRSQAAVSRWLDPENSQFFDLHHYAVLCIYLQIPRPLFFLPLIGLPASIRSC